MKPTPPGRILEWLLLLFLATPLCAETFRVATYNVENYLDAPAQTRRAKSVEAKAAIRENIRALKPDVIALEEMGSRGALEELRTSLKSDGLDFPHWEWVNGADTNIHIAILSKFPFTARRPHTNDNFLLNGRRFQVSRGFAEVDIQVTPTYSFTLLAAHLKSKRPVPQADQADLRLEEAKLLHEAIEARLVANPEANLVVLGDLNDSKDSPAIKAVIGRGRNKLVDTLPAERNGDHDTDGEPESRAVTWTYYYAKEDTYSRIDYILLNQHMARDWQPKGTFVLRTPGWGLASDHRPIIATFETK